MNQLGRKPIRLEASIYATPGIVFSTTIGTHPRAPIFADLEFGLACVGVLRNLQRTTRAPVYAFCLMPDHAHLLLGASPHVSVVEFIQRWKSLCYRESVARGRGPRSPWQRSFWDHGLRADEDLWRTAKYILHNPVRAGLVNDFREYRLCGSLEWEL